MPDYLAPFAKMAKIGLPAASIKHKMRAAKVDENLYDLWLDPAGPKGATAGAAAMSAPPPNPGRSGPPANPMQASRPAAGPPKNNLLAGIRAGTQLKKAAPVQKRPVKGSGLLGAIKSMNKNNLKKAGDRKLNEIDMSKVKVSSRDNMMSAIRGGAALKKVKRVAPKKKEEDPNSIFAMLQKRNELIADSDDEDSDSEWSDSD